MKHFISVLTALTVIWFFMIVSYMLRNVYVMTKLGELTLYFCGSEYIIQTIVYNLLGMVVVVKITNALQTVIYSFFLLLVAKTYLVPIEKKMGILKNTLYSWYYSMM